MKENDFINGKSDKGRVLNSFRHLALIFCFPSLFSASLVSFIPIENYIYSVPYIFLTFNLLTVLVCLMTVKCIMDDEKNYMKDAIFIWEQGISATRATKEIIRARVFIIGGSVFALLFFIFDSIFIYSVNLMYSVTPFLYLSNIFVLWIIILMHVHNKTHPYTFKALVIASLLMVSALMIPFITVPFTLEETDAQFLTLFGSGWDNDVDGLFLDSPYSGSSIYLEKKPPNNYNVKSQMYVNRLEYQLYFDVYTPKKSVIEIGNNKTIIFIHGGGFFGGTRNDKYLLKYLSSQGYICFSLDYRLVDVALLGSGESPNVPGMISADSQYLTGPYGIKDMISDIGNFTYFLAKNNHFGADLDDVTVIGQSAGAFLAGLMGFGHKNEWYAGIFSKDLNITGLVLYYPPDNASNLLYYDHPSYNSGDLSMITGSPETNPDEYNHYTPSYLINGSSLPTLLLQGTLDKLSPPINSQTIYDTMVKNNAPCIMLKNYNLGHVFVNSEPFRSMSCYYIERFLYNIPRL